MTLHLEVVTPQRVLIEAEVDEVTAPGEEGEFGVLPEHQDFFTRIVPGEMTLRVGDRDLFFTVTSGYAEVCQDRVVILVDAAEKLDEIDIERARAAKRRAEERLAVDTEEEDIDVQRAELALRRALIRLQFVKDH